jgi:hypothetical protein
VAITPTPSTSTYRLLRIAAVGGFFVALMTQQINPKPRKSAGRYAESADCHCRYVDTSCCPTPTSQDNWALAAVASSTESKTMAEHLLSIDKQLFGRCLLSAALKLKRRQIYFKRCWDKAKV